MKKIGTQIVKYVTFWTIVYIVAGCISFLLVNSKIRPSLQKTEKEDIFFCFSWLITRSGVMVPIIKFFIFLTVTKK
jgi:hypothetical protein